MLTYCRRNSRDGGLLLAVQVFAFGRRDPVADLGCGGLAMAHAGEHRHGFGPRLAAADGHVGGLVGAEDGQRMGKGFEPAAELVESLEGHVLLREMVGRRKYERARMCKRHGRWRLPARAARAQTGAKIERRRR